VRTFLAFGRTKPAFTMLALVCALFINVVSAAESENAEDPGSLFDKKFSLTLGGYFPYVDSSVQLGSVGKSGASVGLERDLGLKQWSASAWLGFNWRFLPRHQLHVEWFQLNRDGETTVEKPLPPIGGSIYTLGARLDSSLRLNIGRVSYGYSFIRDDRNDLAFVAGLHIATAKASITGTGFISVDGAPVAEVTHTESTSSVTFPLPHLGFIYNRKLTPRLTGNVTMLGFGLEVGNFSGYLIEIDGTLSYQLTKHLGIGGGAKYYNVNVTSKSASGNNQFDMQFIGPTIYLYGTF